MPSKHLRYALEAAGAHVLYGLLRLLPLDAASALGGRVMRRIGPRAGISRVARRNIARAFPDKSGNEREEILADMWENLGRVIGEYPHLRRVGGNVELRGAEHLEAVRDGGGPAIFFAGHIANWEISVVAAKRLGLPLHLVYRKPNNPWVDGLLRHARNAGAAGHIEKGVDGAREIMARLRKGGAVGMLVDQRMNEGLPVPFFGRDAMTAPAIAHFALKFGCPLYPSRVERLEGARFRLTVYPPLPVSPTGDKDADVRRILGDINALLETWVRERPAQWLWIHRRWPD